MAKRRSHLEDKILFLVQAYKLPVPEREFRFHPTRKWRFDLAYPYQKIAVELEGGVWISGRHNRAPGFIADCEKYSVAAIMGWIVIRLTSEMINNGTAIELINKALEVRNGTALQQTNLL